MDTVRISGSQRVTSVSKRVEVPSQCLTESGSSEELMESESAPKVLGNQSGSCGRQRVHSALTLSPVRV